MKIEHKSVMKDLLEVLRVFFSGFIRLGFQVLTEVNSKITPFLECDGAEFGICMSPY